MAKRPVKEITDRFLAESDSLPLSYGPVGIAQRDHGGFTIDELVAGIGRGDDDFRRAKAALTAWKHFDLGWLTAVPSSSSPVPGTIIAVAIRHFGFWSLNGCRVVYGIGDRQSSTQFGFAYGTLTNHAEAGEELFEVFMQPSSAEVMYRIRAASRPRSALTWAGYPLVRMLQERCRRESAAAMRRAVRLRHEQL